MDSANVRIDKRAYLVRKTLNPRPNLTLISLGIYSCPTWDLCPKCDFALLHPRGGAKGVLCRRCFSDRGCLLLDLRSSHHVLGQSRQTVSGTSFERWSSDCYGHRLPFRGYTCGLIFLSTSLSVSEVDHRKSDSCLVFHHGGQIQLLVSLPETD